MICINCTRAGEENKAGHFKRSANWHDKCGGCECQHKTGHAYVKVDGSKVPLMQTQSP